MASAELRLRAGAPADAAPLLEAAVAVREDPGALMRLGLIREMMGRNDEAREGYERFIAVQPQSFVGYNQLAWHLARRGVDLETAASLAERANELQPGNASVLDTLGWIAFLRGDGETALTRLRQARAAGALPVIDFHLAQAELRHGDRERGLSLLRGLVDAGPDAYAFSAQARAILAGDASP